MDEQHKSVIKQQGSLGSDSNSEDAAAINRPADGHSSLIKRICLVGNAMRDVNCCSAAASFSAANVAVVTSETGLEYIKDHSCPTIFVVESFESEAFGNLSRYKHPLLGPPALQQLAAKKEHLPDNTRPLYNLAMTGVVVCFTGFRNKTELTKLVPLVHHMGGSIRKDMSSKVTHLIANVSGGDKYQYAITFRVPVMNLQWVLASWWEHRHDINFNANSESFMSDYKLKPFHGAKVCFMGFPEEEEKHMVEILESNGGQISTIDDATCTHVVMDQSEKYQLEANDSLTSSDVANLSPIKPCPASSSTQTLAMSEAFRTPKLNTLHEHHAMDVSADTSMFNTTVDLQNLDLDSTAGGGAVCGSARKRKLVSPDRLSFCSKRKRDLSYSENTRRRISSFFKTPLGYLSNRRRTIGGAQNQSLNESVISSSGVFEVETVENLSTCNRPSLTPTPKVKKPRKNLFQRTFSTSKFARPKAINDSFSSITSEFAPDASEKLNSTCFPDFSSSSTIDMPPPSRYHELRSNIGQDQRVTTLTHSAVVDESKVTDRPDGPSKAHVVKAEWFWTSVQKEFCLEEKDYLFDDYIEKVLSPNTRRDSHQATPSSASRRKRKRLHETLSSLAQQQSPACVVHHKRRSSISDAGLLSVSGSFLDCTASPDKALQDAIESPAVPDTPRKGLTARQQVFLELVQTESNYVNILHTIMNMFKKHLEDMDEEDALLNNTELKIIFGNLPPIYETHVQMLDELRKLSLTWSEDKSIGSIILKYATNLLKAYPPFVNFFEEMKDQLTQCDMNKPRFHAFLKVCQTKPECGRQSLQDLLIRPVQRLPSILLLLGDILKHTPKSNADHGALDQALASIREVMTHINEDKRKTEGQRVMFDIFNDIDNCPPDLVSSHRTFVTKCEAVQLCNEGLSCKGSPLLLFLFSDQLEICKKRSKGFQTLKSPNTLNGGHYKNSASKPYKHVRLMSLSMIKRVIDIRETDDCQRAFGFVFRNNDELKERLFTFTMAGGEDVDKMVFLKTLCRTMATNTCTADADKFLVNLDPVDLEINTSMMNNGTLSKAIKLAANRTKIRVGRAFSFNKTPSKLKRAVSSMMSPFGSSTNLTPSSQLAQMRLASYNNISELGNAENAESLPLAPLSVQPTRKLKTGSLGVNALKRL